jgi:hypothetical protein
MPASDPFIARQLALSLVILSVVIHPAEQSKDQLSMLAELARIPPVAPLPAALRLTA